MEKKEKENPREMEKEKLDRQECIEIEKEY